MLSSLKLKLHHLERLTLTKYIHFTSLHLNKNDSNDTFEKHRADLMRRGLPKVKPIENVKHIILIASGKGGVGKSTTAVNLATAMKTNNEDKHVGLLDADIFGPSLPLMMNLHDTPLVDRNKQMLPLNNYGIKCMSMGFLIEEGSPVIWRGLMVMQALEKLMRGVHWGPIDYLFIDTPPGTGDTHLSLIQNLPIDGVILVTTPQNAALQVAKRGAIMFQKLKVPVIGVVENMSSIKCTNCSSRVQLFGDGTEKLAQEINVPILQRIPLESELSSCSDNGIPIIILEPDNELSVIYKNMATQVLQFLQKNN